jgi:tRNA-dihydrouridine synthase B
MLTIGQTTIPSRLLLAPLAGISDLPFRLLNRSFGCQFAFTEMISATSLVHQGAHTLRMLHSTPEDSPLGVQLLGGDPAVVADAVDALSTYRFALIDFNAACPVKKVVSGGKGAALLREPRRLQGLLETIVRRTTAPVTVKIRSGFDGGSVNAAEIARRAQDAGVSGLCIHGRTRVQGYSGAVDYETIRTVKEALAIPVLASGDALTPGLIGQLFDETGCDGVVVARGALGNPWIFPQTVRYLEDGVLTSKPDIVEIQTTMERHLAMNVAYYGERTGVMLFRKFFIWYARGIPVKDLKRGVFRACTEAEMGGIIKRLGELPL